MGSSKTQSRVTPEIRELISLTAKSTAEEATRLCLEAASGQTNYYRAVEALLYNYCKLRKLVENKDGYTATMPNTGYAAKSDDEIRRQKEISYQRTKAQLEEVERVISLFREQKEFIVIRMYYFNQDIHGKPRPEKYTFEEITEELSELGLLRDAKTARRWCSKIINDMAVCMFGMPAAVSAATAYKQM